MSICTHEQVLGFAEIWQLMCVVHLLVYNNSRWLVLYRECCLSPSPVLLAVAPLLSIFVHLPAECAAVFLRRADGCRACPLRITGTSPNLRQARSEDLAKLGG